MTESAAQAPGALGKGGPAANPEGTFLFLSELLGKAVRGPDGARLGRLVDLLADGSDNRYPRVVALRVQLSGFGAVQRVNWEDVLRCGPQGVLLRRGREALVPLQSMPNEIPLAQEVLDRQILDIDDAKVERVNDLHLLRARGDLRVAHVDVGFRGLVRRMGWQKVLDPLVRALRGESARYLKQEHFVTWKHVQPLAEGAARVKLDVSRKGLSSLHPADLADILEDLDRRERAVLFRELPMQAAADALEEAEPELQRELLKSVAPEMAADLLEEMAPDDAADLLADLPKDESREILAAMEAPEAREVQELLRYDEESAGGMMTPNFLRVSPDLTAAQALESVRTQAKELGHIHDAFVVGFDGRMVGVIPLRDLLLASPSQAIAGLLREHPAPQTPRAKATQVAEDAAKYNLFSLPVVSEEGRILGVVTVDDILEKVLHG